MKTTNEIRRSYRHDMVNNLETILDKFRKKFDLGIDDFCRIMCSKYRIYKNFPSFKKMLMSMFNGRYCSDVMTVDIIDCMEAIEANPTMTLIKNKVGYVKPTTSKDSLELRMGQLVQDDTTGSCFVAKKMRKAMR